MQRLESSQIKARQFKTQLEALEGEKELLEREKAEMLTEQNKESEQWKARYKEMTAKNDEVIANLAQANQCYFNQVSENEKLAKQVEALKT